MDTLYHLTLNSGHVHRSPRSDCDPNVIARLVPMIENEGGGFPGLGIGFDIYRPWMPDRTLIPGAAIFNIIPWPKKDDDRVYVTGFCCWREKVAEMVWQEAWDMTEVYRDVMEPVGFPNFTIQAIPPETPWLAVMVFPIAALNLDPDRLMMLGDMERCLFWAAREIGKS